MERSFAPLIGRRSKILILGSLPGVQSLAANEYYAHKHNHFWKIVFTIFGCEPTDDYQAKCKLLLDHRLALWDIAKSAEREGSLDSNIKNLIPNDIPSLLTQYPSVRFLIFNGNFSYGNYRKFFGEPTLPYEKVLSTSPACAGREREKLEMWRRAIEKGLAL